MRKLRIINGLVLWLIAFSWLGYLLNSRFMSDDTRVANDLWQFVTAKRVVISLDVPPSIPLAVGDPIYQIAADSTVTQIGEVKQLDLDSEKGAKSDSKSETVLALLYPSTPPLSESSQVRYFSTRDSLSWVVETMLPPTKRRQIAREISKTYAAHRSQILNALQPIVVNSLSDAMQVIQEDLAASVTRHRPELEKLGDRYQEQVVQDGILPLVRDEVWPIVRQHAEPLASEIGQAMWDRASLWRFGWRYFYDRLPLSEKHLTRDEWHRFVNEEGLPIIERYSDQIVAVQRRILSELSNNQEIRTAIRDNLTQVIDDPESRKIAWQIMRETMIDNPRLQRTLENHWRGAEARNAVELAASYVEPCARRIGDMLLGTREEGISPEFAQVLRNQILGKDRRWLVLETPADSIPVDSPTRDLHLPVLQGGNPSVNPFSAQANNSNR